MWGHVKFGGDIVASGLESSDPYSFGSDRPWINHEWLAEVTMHLSWAAGGNVGLIAAKTLLALVTAGFVLAALSRVPMSAGLQLLLIFAVLAGIRARIYVFRPQIFSLVLFAALLWILRSVEAGSTRRLWLVPIVFVLWVNLHGGWIVGLGAFGLWSVLNLTPWGSYQGSSRETVAVLAVTVLATLVNPYGIGMWSFILETVRLDRTAIADWQPLLNTGSGKIVAWGTAAILGGIALFHRRPSVPLSHVLLTVGFGAASLKVSRLDAFFSLSVVMLLASQAADFAEGTRRRVAETDVRRWIWPAALATAVLLMALVSPRRLGCVSLDAPWMPEREAISWIKSAGAHGRLLTWFDWGQYAIWHLAPDMQVSFDGRRETVYSSEYIHHHTNLYFEPETQLAFLDRLDVTRAWLAADLPLVRVLEARGWARAASGPKSVLLVKAGVAVQPVSPTQSPGCFPGP